MWHGAIRAGSAVAVVLLTAACGVGATAGPVPPTGPDQLVLRLAEVPGMLPPGGRTRITPTYSLYGDGRLITAAETARSPWPTLSVHRIDPGKVRDLLADATALPESADPEGAVDAPMVDVTGVSAGQRRTVTLPRWHAEVARLGAALKAAAAGPVTPYLPAAVAVITTPGTPAEAARPWPLPALAGDPLPGGGGARCLVLHGSDLDLIRQATATATIAVSQWRSGGETWQVMFRPLLPDESTCPPA